MKYETVHISFPFLDLDSLSNHFQFHVSLLIHSVFTWITGESLQKFHYIKVTLLSMYKHASDQFHFQWAIFSLQQN